MNKKLLLIISLIVVFLNSCVVEEYEQPRKTEIGFRIASNTMTSILTYASLADIARVADMWNKANTQDKYPIEDKYFGNSKLRLIGDTISIVGALKINTFGKPLSNNTWEIILQNNLKCTVANITPTIFSVEGDFRDPFSLTVEMQNGGSEALISGQGNLTQLTNLNSWYTNLKYTISNPIKIDLGSVEHNVYWVFSSSQISGELDINPYNDLTQVTQDNTKVTLNLGTATIFFRNRTEDYSNIYWGYYNW